MNYFVSGANRGLGLELVKQLLDEKENHVIATARDPEKANELNELAEKHKGRLAIYPLDVASSDSISHLKKTLGDEPIDVLINNAGRLTQTQPFPKIELDILLEEFKTNALGTLEVCQAFFDNVLVSDKKMIVNISTKMASIQDNTGGGQYAYRTSKTALNMISRSMAVDLKPHGITVLILHPGWAQTRMGGPNAWITTEESVTGMLKVISEATLEQSGHFLEYTGKELPW